MVFMLFTVAGATIFITVVACRCGQHYNEITIAMALGEQEPTEVGLLV